jgi:hypothetical protein
LYVNFGSAKFIAGYKIKQVQAGGYNATRFKVQKSDDTATWVDIDDVTTSDLLTIKTLSTIHGCQYVRFYAVEGGGKQWQIATVEVYEQSS